MSDLGRTRYKENWLATIGFPDRRDSQAARWSYGEARPTQWTRSEVTVRGTPRRRILVVGCSGRKLPASELPAVDRYDSPSFRVLRRYLASCHDDALAVYILSAEHGLISGDRRIALYDRRMTIARAHQLRPGVLAELRAQAGGDGPVDVLLCCSQTYRVALDGCEQDLPAGSTVRHAPARPGERLACIHDWLRGRPPVVNGGHPVTTGRPVTIQLRGLRLTLTTEEVLERGRRALKTCEPQNARPSSWAVGLDGAEVSPKWLVATCFGLRHSDFGTSDALRVLSAVGILVRRRQG